MYDFSRLSSIKEVLIFIAAYSVLLGIALLCEYWQNRLEKIGKD